MRDLWYRAGLMLLCTSCWWVAEEAVDGRGLIVACGWCLAAGQFLLSQTAQDLQRPRHVAGVARRIADIGMLLLVAGHVISACYVFREGGDRRAALNLTLEWIGLLAAWLVVSRQAAGSGRGSALLLELIVVIVVGQAALGVVQHHVVYSQNAEWYRERRAVLDAWFGEGEPGGLRSGISYAQVQQILTEFRELQIPLEGPSRGLWENRALFSQEPIGSFALANTLAGLLSVGFLVLVGRLIDQWRNPSYDNECKERFSAILLIVLCGYCLLLTKSRSAWLGTLVGLGVLWFSCVGVPAFPAVVQRRLYPWLLGVCGLVLLGGVVLLRTGSLDREVLAEAPRSLQFRLMYWTGTVRMLREHPWTGAGPGNFRESYMPFKSDESSEEIRDPHNLLLDAWSSSGVTGLLGLALLSAAVLWQVLSRFASASASGGSAGTGRTLVAVGGYATDLWKVVLPAFLLDVFWEWLSLESFGEKWLDLLLLCGLVFLPRRSVQPGLMDRSAALSGLSAMCVHLLAAGGFETPAVMLMVLVCLAVVCGGAWGEADQSGVTSRAAIRIGFAEMFQRRLVGVVFLAMAVVILSQGVAPAIGMRALVGAAELQAGGTGGNGAVQALQLLEQAQLMDPLAVRPRQVRVEILAGGLLAECAGLSGRAGSSPVIITDPLEVLRFRESLEKCEAACERLIEADNRSPAGYLYRGRCRGAVGRLLADLPLQQQACEDYERVLQRYRGKAILWAESAELLWAVGEAGRAIQAAGRALALQQVNEHWGHQEQLLEPAVLKRMEQLVGSDAAGRQVL